ncbi:integrase catalytic domain-containing protein [Trichonephila clavipes]|nr:integrase catalytic domain-containing protein [Trichonephila clavipes]
MPMSPIWYSGKRRQMGLLNDYQAVFNESNLPEQIPDILDRFRSYPIGFFADIKKAFLRLRITPVHRDFLRFFYPKEDEEISYRHGRVALGVSSSPFLLAAVLSHLLENSSSEYSEIVDKLKLSFYVDDCVTWINNIKQQ